MKVPRPYTKRIFRALVIASVAALLGTVIIAQSSGSRIHGAAEQAATVSKAGMDPERLARIPARMKEFVEKGTIAGAVTLVARHGVVASLEAVGYQDLESQKPMRTDTIFNIESMIKSLTAAGVMILLEEGRLLLNDPVEKYLPEFRGQMLVDRREGEKVVAVKKPSRPITIRDLLTHTSGMSTENPGNIQLRDKTLSENVRILAREPLEFEPGTKFWYKDAGFWTLGRIIEVISGQRYETFMEERVFRPLGMKDTFYVPPPEKYHRLASAYKLENGKLQRASRDPTTLQAMWKTWKFFSPAGACYSTASDMFAFYQMVLNAGTYNGVRILSRAAVEAMTTVQTGDLPSTGGPSGPTSRPVRGYGLGWVIVLEPYARMPFLSIGSYLHGGGLGTSGSIDPKKDLLSVFLIQRDGGRVEQDTFGIMAAAAIAN